MEKSRFPGMFANKHLNYNQQPATEVYGAIATEMALFKAMSMKV